MIFKRTKINENKINENEEKEKEINKLLEHISLHTNCKVEYIVENYYEEYSIPFLSPKYDYAKKSLIISVNDRGYRSKTYNGGYISYDEIIKYIKSLNINDMCKFARKVDKYNNEKEKINDKHNKMLENEINDLEKRYWG